MLGIISIVDSVLVFPSAIVSGLFFGFAGIKHLVRRQRNLNENDAMVSDLFLFAVLAVYLVLMMVVWWPMHLYPANLLITITVLVPNLLFLFFLPKNAEKYGKPVDSLLFTIVKGSDKSDPSSFRSSSRCPFQGVL